MNVEMTAGSSGPSSVGILVSDKKKASGKGRKQEVSAFDSIMYKNLGFQMQVRLFYDSNPVQYFFTGLILLNFIIILIAATTWALNDPDITKQLKSVDRLFVYIFLIELIINMYGNWFWHFWAVSRWNHFDFIVIVLSLASPVMSAVRVARVVRLLRVLRVAGKLESLRTIVATFDRSMNAVAAVVALLLMLMSIYAVFGVNDYKDLDPVNFGDLGKAMFTMFQLVTIEGWPDIARNLMAQSISAPIFFVSFMIIAALTTVEVVAAIFLDKMAEAKDYVKEEATLAEEEMRQKKMIVQERIAVIGRFNAGDITGDELQDELDKLTERDLAIEEGRMDASEVETRVDKAKTMHLSMEMADAMKASLNLMDTDGDGELTTAEMDMGIIDILGKLSSKLDTMSERLRSVEQAVGAKGKKGRKGVSLING